MTSLSETDATVKDDASAMASVVVPWHYLGAIQCLARGSRMQTLHDALLGLPAGSAKVRTALEADQGDPNSTTDGLLDRVLAIARVGGYSKPDYTWDLGTWPKYFPIHLRTTSPDIFLSKDGFFLPWPWDGANGLLKARREAAFPDYADPQNPVNAPVLTTNGGLRLTAFMHAADDAVTVMWADFRDWVTEGNSPKQWIVNRAVSKYNYTGPSYPANLTVTPDPFLAPIATAWEINRTGGEMTLKLGTMGLPTTKIKIDERNFHEWPCGAFV